MTWLYDFILLDMQEIVDRYYFFDMSFNWPIFINFRNAQDSSHQFVYKFQNIDFCLQENIDKLNLYQYLGQPLVIRCYTLIIFWINK